MAAAKAAEPIAVVAVARLREKQAEAEGKKKDKSMKKVEHPKDCIRIRNAFLELGYDLNLYEVERFWRALSKYKSSVDEWLQPVEIGLKQLIEYNLYILNEIPFLPKV